MANGVSLHLPSSIPLLPLPCLNFLKCYSLHLYWTMSLGKPCVSTSHFPFPLSLPPFYHSHLLHVHSCFPFPPFLPPSQGALLLSWGWGHQEFCSRLVDGSRKRWPRPATAATCCRHYLSAHLPPSHLPSTLHLFSRILSSFVIYLPLKIPSSQIQNSKQFEFWIMLFCSALTSFLLPTLERFVMSVLLIEEW